jgi:hypothetical protein
MRVQPVGVVMAMPVPFRPITSSRKSFAAMLLSVTEVEVYCEKPAAFEPTNAVLKDGAGMG